VAITAEMMEQEFDAPDAPIAEQPQAQPADFVASQEVAQGSARMAAAWEDDDALAAELQDAPAEIPAEQPAPQAGESRSVLTNRNNLDASLNTIDPFEADDRTAQVPEDLFDEPEAEPIPQLENRIDAVQDAVEGEINRRQREPQELIDEPRIYEPEDSFDLETVEPDDAEEDETEQTPLESEEEPSDEAEDQTQINGQKGPSDLNFQLQTPPKQDSDMVRPFGNNDFVAEEIRESQKNCEEELAALKSDRIDSVDLSIHIDGVAGEDFPYECQLGNEELQPRVWPEITYTWKASALCHKPLYFEQTQLERYGHTWPRCVQPIMSGAHFFGSVAILPYKMGLETPNECIYSLGHYRPGSCAPYYIEAIPFTWRAAAFQTGAVTGLHFATP
jgi:hypothetical protein